MPTSNFQAEMFKSKTLVSQLVDGELEYWPAFFDANTADALYSKLCAETKWQQDTITVYGKQHLTPRLSYWMGDAWMDYSYSNHTMQANPWNDTVLGIKQRVEARTGDAFNSVLINYYRDGRDSNAWHSDDEPELGTQPIIASLSLGAERDFQLRHKRDKSLKHTIKLEHGSLLLMRPPMQAHWQHQLPKRAKVEGRINLTFRTMIPRESSVDLSTDRS